MKNIGLILKMMKFWAQKKNPLFEIFMKGKKVLDIGCGEGNLLKKDRNNIYGIDKNKTLIEKLQSEGLLVKYGDATQIPFEDNCFDVVHCRDVIEHLFPEQAREMFFEMKRILKSGGIIILITPMPKMVWNTFGHIKPYPPMAIKKIFRKISLESFDSISDLKIEQIFYFGYWISNKIVLGISTFLAQFFYFFKGSYLMVIRKQ